ncbi:hypothetical protein [Cryobacterium sp. TMS1-20-1]|uniref:hypothetical protein n=1 Tax=Cryobacterium sp. TMS1-20-1 TaxID=1259223 RepID=UPI00141B2A1B|nr:hypothetical protein [Cryobacterium sp. TMS1-20-1]
MQTTLPTRLSPSFRAELERIKEAMNLGPDVASLWRPSPSLDRISTDAESTVTEDVGGF